MIFREYPFPVTNHSQRYAFEHGPHSFWRWDVQTGWPAMLVTGMESHCRNSGTNPRTLFGEGTRATGLSAVITWSSGEQADKKARGNCSKGADSPFR